MFKKYVSMLRREFKGYNLSSLGADAMAGLTVTAVALPLAIAFGVSCGADAAAGLITAIIAGLIIGFLSGASYQISGPTGAMSAVLASIVLQFGKQGIFFVSFLAGIILLLAALLRVGKLVSMIPRSVITGFTSGIAIIIALGQIDNFFGVKSVGENAIEKLLSYGDLGFSPNFASVGIGLLVMGIMIVFPKKWNARIPSSLVAIIIATAVSAIFSLDVATVGEIPRTIFLEDRLNFKNVQWKEFVSYLSPAISIAALGMIESLLCGASASRMKNEPFDADQELVAQGIGNVLIPFFGGVPATAAIARTSVAIKSGGRTRLTGIFHAVGLLLSMFLLAPIMKLLPLSALSGVLFITAWRMNEWHEIRYIFKKKFRSAILEFSITLIATVLFDLTVAIIIGIIVAALFFVVKSAQMRVEISPISNQRFRGTDDVEKTHSHSCIVYISGPIFFASVDTFTKEVANIPKNIEEVIFSLRGVKVMDITGVENLMETTETMREKGIAVKFCGIDPSVAQTLNRAGFDEKYGEYIYKSIDHVLLDKHVEEAVV